MEKVTKLWIPAYCPCCGAETEIKTDTNSGVQTLWCTNPACPAKGLQRLKHFVSRDAMNIDGLSVATLEQLMDVGLITDIVSIYKLESYVGMISSLEGFGTRSANKLIEAIDKSRKVKLANFIYALGIPNVGLSTAKTICKYFGNDVDSVLNAEYSDLVQIDGIGDTVATNFEAFMNDAQNSAEIDELLTQLNIVYEEISSDTSMAGITICVTGAVNIFPNRDTVKEIVENMGGKLTGSVSKSTSYLVTNDTTSGSRKNRAAQEYGIPILTEEEFINKFNIKI